MKVVVNGTPLVFEDGATVAQAVVAVTQRPRGVAVAVNGEVVPRDRWELTGLRADDQVEVLTAAQGG